MLKNISKRKKALCLAVLLLSAERKVNCIEPLTVMVVSFFVGMGGTWTIQRFINHVIGNNEQIQNLNEGVQQANNGINRVDNNVNVTRTEVLTEVNRVNDNVNVTNQNVTSLAGNVENFKNETRQGFNNVESSVKETEKNLKEEINKKYLETTKKIESLPTKDDVQDLKNGNIIIKNKVDSISEQIELKAKNNKLDIEEANNNQKIFMKEQFKENKNNYDELNKKFEEKEKLDKENFSNLFARVNLMNDNLNRFREEVKNNPFLMANMNNNSK